MNKQSIGKLKLFLTGLEQRITENGDFFIEIAFDFKSGTKLYSGKIYKEDDSLRVSFNGNIKNINIEDIAESVCAEALNYESIVLKYIERGTSIIIEGDSRNVNMRTEQLKEETANLKKETSQIGNREYLIKVGQADSLLTEIGILGKNGKVKNDMIRKYNQIDHFVELIDPILRELAQKHGSITVLDCGCGKSYLSFVLNFYIKEVLKKPCHFIGIDYSPVVINASKQTAKNLGYSNMDFKEMDLNDYVADRRIDLVISLHACDTATDMAMALAVNNKVEAMVMVPCCHKELLSQYSFEPFSHIIKHGVFKARIADALTDGMRSMFLEAKGYNVSTVEYISPLETPKNLMIRGIKGGPENPAMMEEYRKIKKLLNVKPSLERLVE
jgi:SAM-dependent methyltransferase